MTRIGVMTFLHNDNYGSILQAWALQRTLLDLGFDAEHIDYAPSKQEKVKNLLLSGNSPRLILDGVRKRSAASKMHGGFDAFRQANLRTSAVCRDHAALRKRAEAYDVLLAGSDQIWSPEWLNPAYFLDFTQRPRVAYAPSLGVRELPERRKQRKLARLTKGYAAISIREAEGAKLLRQMAGVDAPVMPDPVMLLPKERWLALAKREEQPERYILCYFIGNDDAYWARVREIAEQKQCGVRVIPRTEAARQAGYPLVEDVPPERWLGLIAGAAHVVTDSFHGACFSAILNRPCSILRRYREDDPDGKNSRVDQLLRNLGVSNLEAPDWRLVNEGLAKQAQKGKKWLLDAVSQAAQKVNPAGET